MTTHTQNPLSITVTGNATVRAVYQPIAGCGSSALPVASYSGNAAHRNAVLLQDGRVFMYPNRSTYALIYDPKTDSTSKASGSYLFLTNSSCALVKGVLLNDGRVFMIPTVGTSAYIYDPAKDSLSMSKVVLGPNNTNKFSDAVVLKNGNVFLLPAYVPNALIYDPITDSVLKTANGTFNAQTTDTAVVLQDGRVFIPHRVTETVSIYDPVSNKTTQKDGNNISSARAYAILLNNGNVLTTVNGWTYVYDVQNSKWLPQGGTLSIGSYTPSGLIPLKDGRAVAIGAVSSSPKIYNSGTISNAAVSLPGGSSYQNGVQLQDGRVFLVPHNATEHKIFSV